MAEQENDHGTRIALLEQGQRDTKEFQRDTGQKLTKIGDEMAKIAHAVVQQVEDRSALGRAFDRLEIHTHEIAAINRRMDKHDKDALQAVIDAQAAVIEEGKRKRREFWGIMLSAVLMAAGTVVAGLMLYHFGVKP